MYMEWSSAHVDAEANASALVSKVRKWYNAVERANEQREVEYIVQRKVAESKLDHAKRGLMGKMERMREAIADPTANPELVAKISKALQEMEERL